MPFGGGSGSSNAADKASASTQAFTGAITSAGSLTAFLGAANQTTLANVNGVSGLKFSNNIDASLYYIATGQLGIGSGANGGACTLRTTGLVTQAITSGALPTIAPVSTTGLQVVTTRDVFLMQVCTFNPTAGAAATCVVALSPDNVTYSTIITVTYPLGVALDGSIPPIGLWVPAAWYVKFTTTNATLGTGTYY